jgi:hypothetical protein
MFNYSLTVQSSNQKLGLDVSAITSDRRTCPNRCPLKNNGCYAEFGPLAIHFRKVSSGERGNDWDTLVDQVNALPKGRKIRFFQAGDCPSKKENSEDIDGQAMSKMADVIKKKGHITWGYSHKKLTPKNVKILKESAAKGLVINASADSLKEADEFVAKGLPTVVTVPSDFKSGTLTPKGNKVIICPQQTKENVTCSSCLLCQKSGRSCVVGFMVHGAKKNKLDERLKAE